MPVNLGPPRPNLYSISPLKNHQGPIESLLGIPSPFNEFTTKSSQTRTPANGQPTLELVFDFADFLHHLLATLAFALGDGVHGRCKEESDGFIDVGFCSNWGERQLGEGLGNTDNGF